MRIAQLCPPWLAVPPKGYGGIEWVVALLAGPLATLAPLARAWAELGVAVVLGGPVTVLVMWLLRVREVGAILTRLERLVDRGNSRRGTRR